MATDTIRRTPKEGLGGQGGRGAPLYEGRVPPGAGGSGGASPRTSTVAAPRHTRPVPVPGARPAPRTTRPRPRARSPRMPFILLLVGLLGGALISLLVISTTLAQGAFRITSLQQQNANLARQEQALSNQVAQASNPALIAKEAEQLGMRPNPRLGFIDLKTGKIIVGKPSKAEAAINVPGYTP
jgi:hypothetical protein